MSDAIKKLHDYLAMSPSVVYPEDVLAYLPAIEDENAKLRNEVDNLLDFEHLTSVAVAYAGCDECGEYKQTMLRLFAENAKLRELVKSVLVLRHDSVFKWLDAAMAEIYGTSFTAQARELGVES